MRWGRSREGSRGTSDLIGQMGKGMLFKEEGDRLIENERQR